jgi:hypothetical protein
MINIDELLELEAKATPEKWIYGEYDDGSKAPHLIITNNKYCLGTDSWVVVNSEFEEGNLSDPELIVAMRNNIKPLLEELKAARKVVEAARELIRGNDLLDEESVMMKDVDHIRAALNELEGGEK